MDTASDSKERFIKIIMHLLRADEDLDSLVQLKHEDSEKFVAVVRARTDSTEKLG